MGPLELIRDRIEEHRAQISDHLMSGGAKSYEDYQLLMGKVQALDYVLSDIAEIAQRFIED